MCMYCYWIYFSLLLSYILATPLILCEENHWKDMQLQAQSRPEGKHKFLWIGFDDVKARKNDKNKSSSIRLDFDSSFHQLKVIRLAVILSMQHGGIIQIK